MERKHAEASGGAVQLNRRWSDVNWLRSEPPGALALEMAFLDFPRELLRSSWPWAPRSPIQSGISAAGTCAVDRTIAAATTTRRRAGSSAHCHSHCYVRGRLGPFTTFTRFTLFGFPLSSFFVALSLSHSLSQLLCNTLRHQHELARVSPPSSLTAQSSLNPILDSKSQ